MPRIVFHGERIETWSRSLGRLRKPGAEFIIRQLQENWRSDVERISNSLRTIKAYKA